MDRGSWQAAEVTESAQLSDKAHTHTRNRLIFLRSTLQNEMLSHHLPSLEITPASCSDCTSLLSWLHPNFCSQVVPLMNVLYV